MYNFALRILTYPVHFEICEEITSQLFARLNAEVLKNMTGELLTASNKRTK